MEGKSANPNLNSYMQFHTESIQHTQVIRTKVMIETLIVCFGIGEDLYAMTE